MTVVRKIIHVDMDAFYAAIEQRDNPELRGKPVVVGGPPNSRGVVATCSYEARPFGIHSAMPASQAYRLCPEAVFVRPRFSVYVQVSKQIHAIFFEYSDLVEPLSLDEAYLDVTVNKKDIPTATAVAKCIKRDIYNRTRLTASAGVSFNKFLAKVASDMNKPDGLTVVRPRDAAPFIARLPIRKFFGVGRVTERKMNALGIRTGEDLRRKSRLWLSENFGKAGDYFYAMAHGEDDRPVTTRRERKSLGKEVTLSRDIDDIQKIFSTLDRLASDVDEALKRRGLRGHTLTLKVRYQDFTTVTRQVTLDESLNSKDKMMSALEKLLFKTEAGKRKVRLLGVSVSNFSNEKTEPSCGDMFD